MAMILLGTFLSVLGVGLSLWYLLKVRPVISAVENGVIPPSRSESRPIDP